MISHYLSPATPRIFAHRGSTEGGAEENTLEAFRFALEAGVSYIETDVQVTRDGVAVLFHDDTLARLTGKSDKVSSLDLENLRQIRLSDGQSIPTLEEALTAFPNARFNLDIKTAGAIDPAVRVISELHVEERVLVSSFSRSRRTKALRKIVNVATSGDAQTVVLTWMAAKFGWAALAKRELAGLVALQIPTHFGWLRFDTPSFVDLVRNNDCELHYWTINDVQEAARLFSLGAAGIVTDRSKMMVDRFLRPK